MSKGEHIEFIRNEMLKWYNKNKRDYPWRKTKDLYKILITEILLQKTISSNVNNVYHEFFEKYPSFSEILSKNISELQSDIKSLGLSNKRAKILCDLSEMIMKDYKGVIPEDPHILKRINGIANYVINAFLCFGLNKRTLFFDVNIKRFMARIFGNSKQVKKAEYLTEKLNELLPISDCKHFYWAILDFGSKICTKNNPKCDSCPLAKQCRYRSIT